MKAIPLETFDFFCFHFRLADGILHIVLCALAIAQHWWTEYDATIACTDRRLAWSMAIPAIHQPVLLIQIFILRKCSVSEQVPEKLMYTVHNDSPSLYS